MKKNHQNAPLAKLLRPYARRIEARRRVKRFALVCCMGAGAALVVTAARFLLPLEFPLAKALLTALGVLVLGALVLPFFPLKSPDMAVEIDKLGFQERVQTAWALRGDDSVFAVLQRQDTEAALGRGDPKALIPIRPPLRSFAIAGSGLLLCCALALLPTPHDQVLEERGETRRVMAEQAQRIEADIEAIARDDSLTEAQRTALNERLQKLAQQLRRENDYREGIKEVSRLQNELSELKKQRAKESAAALKDALSRQSETEALAKDMEGKSPQEAQESMEKAVSDAMDKAGEDGEGSSDAADALSRALAQAAESAAAAGQTQLGDAMKDLSEALAELDEQALAEALEQLQNALDENQEASSLAQLSGDLKLSKSRMSQLSQASNAGNTSQLSNSQQGQDGQDGQEGQDGQSSQQGNQGGSHSGGQGPGQGHGQGQNGGDGQGAGQGQGNGSGSGSGSGQGGTGTGQGSGSGQGAGAGSGALVESEEIYDDRRLGGEGNQVDIQGDLNLDGPRSQADTDAGEGTLDGYLPYKQVVEEYADSAVSAARRGQLPPAVQGWVTEYFDALRE